MKLIDDVGFDQSYSFVYSKRPGTPASNLPDDTSEEVKKQRLARLQAQLTANSIRISPRPWSAASRTLTAGRK